MIAGLDSSTQPSPGAASAARNAGVRLWSGYLQTRPNVGLYAPWSQQGFENARLCGSAPIAFCSGNDDPVALRAMAASWKVRLCLDVERGIRQDGPWVQGFLDASGAGLYGNAPVHRGRRAPFYILAAYPGADPGATWDPRQLAPAGPTGWQWQGTHNEFGVGVDRGWYDDWFASTYGASPGNLTPGAQDMPLVLQHSPAAGGGAFIVDAAGKRPINQPEAAAISAAFPGIVFTIADAALDQIPTAGTVAGGQVDLQPVLDALAHLANLIKNLNLKAA